ncbi:MAG: DUF1572 family protein [Flavobacteriaceae bacterium]|nr:DUF1572 family protein [Flavobacteriaceae bacterium]
MITNVLIQLFERDFDHLTREISDFRDEKNLWLTPNDVNNSAGNLCIHLCGNLQHFIGAQLGNTGYVRNRPYEFGAKHIHRTELLKEVTKAKQIVIDTLKNISSEQLTEEFPIQVWGEAITNEFFLTHLHGHFTYHLGQISYQRRILDR